MNKRKTFGSEAVIDALMIACCALMAACSQEDASGEASLPESKYALQIGSVSIDGAEGSQTRVTENSDGTSSSFQSGDIIGVQIGGGTAGKYKYNGSSFEAVTPCYWQSTSTSTVTAWYPATDGTVSLSDQSSGLAYVLKGSGSGSYSNSVSLSFTHQLAKVVCNLTKGDNLTDEQLETAEVYVYGYTSATCDKGAVGSGTAEGWITATTAGHEALIVPTTLSGGTEFIKVTVCGNDFIYSLPEAKAFEAGYSYTYDITVNADGITVNADGGEWTADESVNVPSYDPALYDGAIYLSSLGDSYTVSENQRLLVVGDDNTYSTKITVKDGATLGIRNVKLSVNATPIDCTGDVTLMIEGENTVTAGDFYPAIHISEGKTLTIDGNGTVTANGGEYAAGIGSGYYEYSCGDITINGGTVTATSENGAGIGSGHYNSSCDNITINGGTVTATSENGAGIGSGPYNSSCGNITINGGTVTATSEYSGAGIGSGLYNSSCDNITINGGTITATGGYHGGAGIGSGYSEGTCGDITISGGTITATGGYHGGVDVGAGDDSSCGTVTYKEGATVNGRVYN